MNEHQKLAIKALNEMRGDDLIRARLRFAGFSEGQMNQVCGFGDVTCASLLAHYEEREARIDAAIAWLEAL